MYHLYHATLGRVVTQVHVFFGQMALNHIGLRTKFNAASSFCNDTNSNVVCASEHWIYQTEKSVSPSIENLGDFYRSTFLHNYGGVSTYSRWLWFIIDLFTLINCDRYLAYLALNLAFKSVDLSCYSIISLSYLSSVSLMVFFLISVLPTFRNLARTFLRGWY